MGKLLMETHPRGGCASGQLVMGRPYFLAAFTGSFTASKVANSTL
jgi:hypothetical protein